MPKKIKRIPYGIADFKRFRRDNAYYVDKTHFIPLLETAPYYLFFLRPRRFGKTLWLSVLENYYDINQKENFEGLFQGTYIGANPTEARNSYLVMSFNFSVVNPRVQVVHESFDDYGKAIVENFLARYTQFFDEDEWQKILALPKAEHQLRRVFFYAGTKGLDIYLLIDEYDNFANTILSTVGAQAYRDLTHGAGFFRYFFNLLKGATTGQMGGIARMFISGVSPITMDDVTSGFNIGDNLSLENQFNELVGFREDEVVEMLRYYRDAGALPLAVDECLDTMRAWYNRYRFSQDAQTHLFNTDMVLYFLKQTIRKGALPEKLIDQNIRTDYGKLRHLITVDRQLNGNFSRLRQIMETGEVVSEVADSFPVEQLLNQENFISLLFYLGLLSFDGFREGEPRLRIPNRTVRKLMYGYLRDGFEDVDIFRIDFWHFARLVRGMAYRGEWQPVFNFLTQEIQKQTSVRDYLKGEKVIQGFLLAYLNVTNYFLTWSEKEMGGGFSDLYLEPFLARYPDMKFGYLIEMKYIPRNKFSQEELEKKVGEAEAQLYQYATDKRLQKVGQHVTMKKLVVIYKGWELVYREEEGL